MESPKVLFANDDMLTQWIMAEVLINAGFSVVGACRWKQVVEFLGNSDDYDMLLIDVALPGVESWADPSHAWQTTHPDRPVIYTGPRQNALQHSLHANEHFLRAPFSASALLHAVDVAFCEARLRPAQQTSPRPVYHVH